MKKVLHALTRRVGGLTPRHQDGSSATCSVAPLYSNTRVSCARKALVIIVLCPPQPPSSDACPGNFNRFPGFIAGSDHFKKRHDELVTQTALRKLPIVQRWELRKTLSSITYAVQMCDASCRVMLASPLAALTALHFGSSRSPPSR